MIPIRAALGLSGRTKTQEQVCARVQETEAQALDYLAENRLAKWCWRTTFDSSVIKD